MIAAAAYGGFAATDFALRFPERIAAFVLATSHAELVDPKYPDARQRIAGPELRVLPVHFRELGPSYRAENPEGVERWIAIEHAAGRPPRQQRLHFQITLPMLETLSVPTLVLAGDPDLLTPPGIIRMVAARIPSCEFAAIPEDRALGSLGTPGRMEPHRAGISQAPRGLMRRLDPLLILSLNMGGRDPAPAPNAGLPDSHITGPLAQQPCLTRYELDWKL